MRQWLYTAVYIPDGALCLFNCLDGLKAGVGTTHELWGLTVTRGGGADLEGEGGHLHCMRADKLTLHVYKVQ